jgi:nicotinate-nucleotide--dimethylbenzimidazole phosphoribosyltransferase
MRKFNIPIPDIHISTILQEVIDSKTKPLGALGVLEKLASQCGLIQQTITPVLSNPQLVVFAADHGIAEENVSAYPQEVTSQMVYNFLRGGAAINVFCKQHQIGLHIVDAGVKHTFNGEQGLIDQKAGLGTANFRYHSALTTSQFQFCVNAGCSIVDDVYSKGCNIIGFGEMGIGNTSSAAVIMHLLTGIPLEECVGRGTGVNEHQFLHKLSILQSAVLRNKSMSSAEEVLCEYGGFEIVQMYAAMLRAAELKMIVLVDGFIATAAFLAAAKTYPAVKDYAVFCHCSHESGHEKMLNYLDTKPLLYLDMRLGEGTGCAVAYPIVQSAIKFLNEMSSFKQAGVSEK